jgi:hypothetical protein
LAETYFKAFDFDLGERELGLVLSLDHDLDVYASSMGLTKTAIEAVLNDEGEFPKIVATPLTTRQYQMSFMSSMVWNPRIAS